MTSTKQQAIRVGRIGNPAPTRTTRWPKRFGILCLIFAAAAIASPAQRAQPSNPTFTTVHNFDYSDGAFPDAGLVQATNGKLYGTTNQGGTNGDGTVFDITLNGTLTPLHAFYSLKEGEYPYDSLIQATDGNLYGTTSEGGPNGYSGTIFKITLGGNFTTVHIFCSEGGGSCTDGSQPGAGLVQASSGSFYGTTSYGGPKASGIVYMLTPGGTLTTLYDFCSLSGCVDGENPDSSLVQATDGNLYGTTDYGGTNGDGTVFRITPSGALTTIYNFCSLANCADGAGPLGGLIQASDGNLYGTTSGYLGARSYGTVFRITLGGELTTLYTFCSKINCGDGWNPVVGLIQATDGNFYGATEYGGRLGGDGTAFSITPSGELTTLHAFDYTDGSQPFGRLVQDTDGNLYGTTFSGGANLDGTIYRLSLGLSPFVEALPASGRVGELVRILGTDLTGATSVSFNSTPAVFTVVSPSLISATVPDGATTGFVTVATPSGTLSSNVKFQVRP